ncbi:hypothetical protein QA584_10770 [Anaerocolumna sp. AGMB13025]|uniref:hypothetical protein n=1 Tax=Anaerocolumna sp. AGMB13025 TaxID=3039116 RepID=UPI00241F0FE7|nr:hypothetical protein [Anaerocolumna sp. AGMB13025]WFR59546.1 hypothetical protein QA584_10770 [Anaerocolumna sp. AGMB13025]
MRIIQWLFFGLIISVIVFSFLFYWLKKKVERKNKYSIFLNTNKKPGKDYYSAWYEFFHEWRVTKRYIKKIARHFEIYMPGDYKRISRSTMKLAFRTWGLDFLLIIFLLTRGPTLYWGGLTIAFLFILNSQVIYFTVEANEIKLLKQFDKLLGDIRHNYQAHGMTLEAIYDSVETAPYPVKLHAVKIHTVLSSEEVSEEVSNYNETVPNRFMKVFLSLCVMMLQFGDKKVDNQSLFLLNIKYLKQEVFTEILKREKMKHLFSGLIFVCLTPVLFLKAIESWAVLSLPEMQSYYSGAFGIVTMIFIFISTLTSYNLINCMKENRQAELGNYFILEYILRFPFVNELLSNIVNKNYGKTLKLQDLIRKTGEPITPKQFILKRSIYSFVTFICCILVSITIHHNNKIQILTNYNIMNYLNSSISEKQIESMKGIIKKYVIQYKKRKPIPRDIEEKLLEEGIIKSKQLMTMSHKEIISRINAYQMEYYHWYELVIALLMGAAAFYVPYLNLLLLKKLRQMDMEDEVIQFHSIILMLMHFDRMTIETMLSWFENFAVIFKKSIQECINELQTGDIEVLEALKRKEPYEPFVKIIENLQISDKIGISKAFDEIAVERNHYQEKRKLENEIEIGDKALIAKVIAFIPFTITIGFYLIIPFIVEGLTQYAGYMQQIKDIY